MTPEEKVRLEACTREIAEILYRNAEAKDVEQLKTLEGIEIDVYLPAKPFLTIYVP